MRLTQRLSKSVLPRRVEELKKAIQLYLKKYGFGHFCPKAVLFDMDGVIYDSMRNHALSWHQSMAAAGIQMDESEAYLYEGMRGVETIKLKARQQWHRELTDEEAQRLYELKASIFSQCPPAPKMEGTEELMRQIKACGLQICVVTGSGQHTLLNKLTKDFPGLIQQDLIVTSYDVKRGKPAPDPYLAGMRKVNTNPWETIVVENAPLGVQAAVAAQCFTIAVNTGPLPDHELTSKGADIIMPDMLTFSQQWETFYKEC
jgi:HAD superfamily hydrolase (TIGR01509 family)